MQPRHFVLDSSAILLYLAGDDRVGDVINRINDGSAEGYIIEQCLSEVYSMLSERFGMPFANKVLEGVKNSRIRVMDVDYDLMKNAGELKSKFRGRLSMIGALMISAARNVNAVILTSDESIAKVDVEKVELIKVKA